MDKHHILHRIRQMTITQVGNEHLCYGYEESDLGQYTYEYEGQHEELFPDMASAIAYVESDLELNSGTLKVVGEYGDVEITDVFTRQYAQSELDKYEIVKHVGSECFLVFYEYGFTGERADLIDIISELEYQLDYPVIANGNNDEFYYFKLGEK